MFTGPGPAYLPAVQTPGLWCSNRSYKLAGGLLAPRGWRCRRPGSLESFFMAEGILPNTNAVLRIVSYILVWEERAAGFRMFGATLV